MKLLNGQIVLYPRSYVMILLLILLSAVSWERNALYFDGATLWGDAANKSPLKARTHNNYGDELHRAQRVAEALHEFELSLQLDPEYTAAMINLASVYCRSYINRRDDAVALLTKALNIDPDNINAKQTLAILYYDTGYLNEALKEFTSIIQIDPDSKEAAFGRRMLDIIATRPH